MLRKLWIEVRSSLWFVPALLVISGAAAAVALVQFDIAHADVLRGKSWQPLLNAGAEGARGMLTAIASSMITVAGVSFSVTIVTLSLASTQYTPRILRNFMRDRANQFVLGAFVAIFTYCLVVLRSIRGGTESDGGSFVPLIAVAFALLLAFVSIGCLIFFIHHVAASIQASYILNAITTETSLTIEKLFPHQLVGGDAEDNIAGTQQNENRSSVAAATSGYIQALNGAKLLELARENDLSLRLERMPGDFVLEGASLISAERVIDDKLAERLRNVFAIGDFRTVGQDAGFGIRQIVDVVMKALSPGVNDTSTAVSCLDYLSVLLSQLANRRLMPQSLVAGGTVRIAAVVPSFADFVAKSFDEIRLSAQGNVTIILQMLCAVHRVGMATKTPARKEVLMQHARVIAESADQSVAASYDRARINQELDALRSASGVASSDLPPLSTIRDPGQARV